MGPEGQYRLDDPHALQKGRFDSAYRATVVETIGGGSRDQIAVNAIMGHADESMAGVYRERIDDERLIAVSNHVRHWLWPDLQDNDTKIS